MEEVTESRRQRRARRKLQSGAGDDDGDNEQASTQPVQPASPTESTGSPTASGRRRRRQRPEESQSGLPSLPPLRGAPENTADNSDVSSQVSSERGSRRRRQRNRGLDSQTQEEVGPAAAASSAGDQEVDPTAIGTGGRRRRRIQKERGEIPEESVPGADTVKPAATARRPPPRPISTEEDLDFHVEEEDVAQADTAQTFFKPEPQSERRNLIFVENTRTGRFRKMSGTTRERVRQTEVEDADHTDALKFVVMKTTMILSTFITACQGLLAGFTLFHFLFIYMDQDRLTFLRYYSPIAAASHQTFLFLSSTCAVGSCDKFIKDRMAGWYDRGLALQFVDSFLVICHFISVIATLVNARTDDLLYYSEIRIPGWYDGLPEDHEFQDTLSAWHSINLLRFLVNMVAWIVLANETRFYHFDADNRTLFEMTEAERGVHTPGPQEDVTALGQAFEAVATPRFG